MNAQLGVILTAMVTPFDSRGDLDLREAGRLARWLVERGNDGLVVAGSTGEGQTLDPRERAALWAAVKGAVGDSDCRRKCRHEIHARVAGGRRGCAGSGRRRILAVVPYYNKPPRAGCSRISALSRNRPRYP